MLIVLEIMLFSVLVVTCLIAIYLVLLQATCWNNTSKIAYLNPWVIPLKIFWYRLCNRCLHAWMSLERAQQSLPHIFCYMRTAVNTLGSRLVAVRP